MALSFQQHPATMPTTFSTLPSNNDCGIVPPPSSAPVCAPTPSVMQPPPQACAYPPTLPQTMAMPTPPPPVVPAAGPGVAAGLAMPNPMVPPPLPPHPAMLNAAVNPFMAAPSLLPPFAAPPLPMPLPQPQQLLPFFGGMPPPMVPQQPFVGGMAPPLPAPTMPTASMLAQSLAATAVASGFEGEVVLKKKRRRRGRRSGRKNHKQPETRPGTPFDVYAPHDDVSVSLEELSVSDTDEEA